MRKTGATQGLNETALAETCPFAHTLRILGARWRPAILWKVSQGAEHFGELARALPNVSEKMLAQDLLRLRHDGLIERQDTEHAVRRSLYRLTDAGRALIPALSTLHAWGETDMRRREAA